MSLELEKMIEQDQKEFKFERTCFEILKGLEQNLNSDDADEKMSYEHFFDRLIDECSEVYSGVTYDYLKGAYIGSGCYSDVRRDAFEFFNAIKNDLIASSELMLKQVIENASRYCDCKESSYYVAISLNSLEIKKIKEYGFAVRKVCGVNLESDGVVLFME